MAKVAIVETKPSKNNYQELFFDEFRFDLYRLCSDKTIDKPLKKDVDISLNVENYDWVILVGAEPFKYYTKLNAITTYSGKLVDEKFLPVINPAMVSFKPEAKRPWEESRDKITQYIKGELSDQEIDSENFLGIEDNKLALQYIQEAIDYPLDYVALDTETTALYPRDGYILGVSLTYKDDYGAYILTDCIDETIENKLQELFHKKTVVFHNAKFDINFLEYHFNFSFPHFEDTMLIHYILDETQGTHGLKELAMRFTKYGDYEKELHDWIANYCKKYRIKKEDFTFDLIPFNIISKYAAIDSAVTFVLYNKFSYYLNKNNRLKSAYKNLLLEGCRFLIDIQDNGVPFDITRLKFSQYLMSEQIENAVNKLNEFPEIHNMEVSKDKKFNPNSTIQLRKLLFDYIGLQPTGKKTPKGEDSTDSEVLEELAKQHEVPRYILDIRKDSKIKNTYIDKIIPQLDKDERLRTNFHLHMTTSGRLSSSGKLNLQQLPRDNPIVKGCIKARSGYKIVAMDLVTAEIYLASVISDDLELQDIFRSKGNFHSSVAKKVFNLECSVDEVKDKYPGLRQASKAISFGILYGASANKIAQTVTAEGISMNKAEAQEVINEYFNTFWKLKEWIDSTHNFIKRNGYIYTPFGRKRRLPNVKSVDKAIVGHELRSGLNAIIQATSSDVNLLGGIDTHKEILQEKIDAKIFALVHDSILAEVAENSINEYCQILQKNIQKDRGVSISDCPIDCEFEIIAEDYSGGKFINKYGDQLQTFKIN